MKLNKVLWTFSATLLASLPLHAADSASATAADHATRNTQHEKPSPLTPEEEKATFTLPPGFEIELVASEPQVMDPVAMAWKPS